MPRERLPPGQRLIEKWPVLDLGVQPDIPRDKWIFTVDGLVENPIRWKWDEFISQPQVALSSDIHCVTGWSRYDNAWSGVHIVHVLETCAPKAEAGHCLMYSSDGYTTNIRIDRLADEDVLLAHSWQGEYLTKDHGGPVRIVIPKWYFWKSAKWIRRSNSSPRTKKVSGKIVVTITTATLERGTLRLDHDPARERSNISEYVFEHFFGKATGIRIVARAMIAVG